MAALIPDSSADLIARRAARFGPNVATFYEEPVHIVRGDGVWLFDADGRRYLDCYNNVPHVGHCNARVVDAICRQASILNVHTRYLHDAPVDYADRLAATFDGPLSTVLMTCTGSEANDIALRMAEALTGRRGIIATDYTYHGNTSAVSQLSRSNVPQTGRGDHVRFVPAPDSVRPLGGETGMAHAHAFAAAVETEIDALSKSEQGFAGLILCPHFVNEGFPDLPDGWLQPAVEAVRKAGGILIADEVQPGFGRIGSHMWAHQRHGFVPDVVTLGKPMANGHPVGAVVATADAMKAFRSSFRYFNTFGGNPVSCAAAMAVLDELEAQKLPDRAKRVGAYAVSRLQNLADKHEAIGDVRGSGLIFGAEMVLDRQTMQPASAFTDRIVNEMRRRGILLSKLGRFKNTLKIRPPMPFDGDNVDLLVETLDGVLSDIPLAP
ncbi:MAG: aspartate aminotransferase family protein [Pseudomonadota bacterium]